MSMSFFFLVLRATNIGLQIETGAHERQLSELKNALHTKNGNGALVSASGEATIEEVVII